MPNTVFLAEANTGADALAAGPVAAAYNVPILITDPTALPEATKQALAAIRPANIIVLGGEGAVSPDVMKLAGEAAGNAKTTRIGGVDRYETSVNVAKNLFGLFPATPGPVDRSTGTAYSN